MTEGMVLTVVTEPSGLRVKRLLDRPIITPELHPELGHNIQGPSVIRVPDWVASPLGKYYLYFADHKGAYIRLAYADEVTGPWTIHPGGSLQLKDSHFRVTPPEVSPEQVAFFEARAKARGVTFSHDLLTELVTPHIASPDVLVDHEHKRLLMYFHGLEGVGTQFSRLAISSDGIAFNGLAEPLGPSYFRVFRHEGFTYALAMPGKILRSADGLTGFEAGPDLFDHNQRHTAVIKRGNSLYVFWTQVGEAPERILLSKINLSGDWMHWKEGPACEVMRPERDWEGAKAPLKASVRSSAYGQVNQLRDPAILEDEGNLYLFYAVAGESGIAIAQIWLE